MVICELCGQEMSTSDGCNYTKITYNGKVYNRIRFGEDGDLYSGAVEEGERCPDCGVKAGKCHHYRCGKENSPVIRHRQMLDYEYVDGFIQ